MQRVDHMLEPPIVGQTYLVPSIIYKMFNDNEPRWYPVMGTRHEDADHLKFPWEHFHPDWRFMPAAVVAKAMRAGGRRYGTQALFGYPLQMHGLDVPEKTEYRRRKCVRTMPENVILASMPLARGHFDAWEGVDAKRGPRGLVCPHRGTILGSVTPNPDGTITCPLHGLKFCARTGKSVSVHQPAIAAAT